MIIDKDPKNLKILQNNFEEESFRVDHATGDQEAFEKIGDRKYDIVLSEVSGPGIDGYRLLENIQRGNTVNQVPVIFLSAKSDVWNRVKSFKLGAKDYIVKPKHVKEIVARVNMVLARLERRSKEETLDKKKFAGRLEDFSLTDLVEAFGIEKKTGILSLYNENGLTGKVFIRNGNIVDAGTSGLKADAAIYKMMSWQKGRFSMLFRDVEATDVMSLSNMGILLQGARRMEQREDLLAELPSLEAIVVTTSNFKKILAQKEMTHDLKCFLDLFDGARSLGRIVDDSREDEITTLKRILKLYRLGFLHVIKDFSREKGIEEFAESDVGAMPSTIAELPVDHHETGIGTDRDDSKTVLLEEEQVVSEEIRPRTEPTDELNRIPTDPFFDYKDEEGFPSEDEALLGELTLLDSERSLDKDHIIETHPADALLTVDVPDSEKEIESVTEEMTIDRSGYIDTVSEQPKDLLKKAKGSILILAADPDNRKQFVDSLTTGKTEETKIDMPDVSDIYFGVAQFKGGQFLNIMSFSLEKEFTPLIDYFGPTILGYIVLIRANQIDRHYYNYLLNVLRAKLSVPSMIVIVANENETDTLNTPDIRQQLGMKESEGLRVSTSFDLITSKQIIFSLFKKYYKKNSRASGPVIHSTIK